VTDVLGRWGRCVPLSSGEMAMLYGDIDRPGPYLVLMNWNPGWFSAPHSYATDRIQMVMSGTWWVNSGADFTRVTPLLLAIEDITQRRDAERETRSWPSPVPFHEVRTRFLGNIATPAKNPSSH
jgi:hypothetical protein